MVGILTLRLTAGLLHAARDYIASGQCHLEGLRPTLQSAASVENGARGRDFATY
jgi:hypothetical protein